MVGDRLVEAVRSVVLRVLEDRDRVDFSRRYQAKVASEDAAAQAVDVVYDDPRLVSKVGVQLALAPGQRATYRQRTRLCVGWLAGDERYPRAYPEWDQDGGLVAGSQVVDQSWTYERAGDSPAYSGPILVAAGDVSRQHDVHTGPAPVVTTLVGTAVLLGGTDACFGVTVTLPSPIAVGVSLFTAVFGRAYSGSGVLAQATTDVGASLGAQVAGLSAVTVVSGANESSGGVLKMNSGTYVVTVRTSGY